MAGLEVMRRAGMADHRLGDGDKASRWAGSQHWPGCERPFRQSSENNMKSMAFCALMPFFGEVLQIVN